MQDDAKPICYSLWTAAEYGDEACVRAHIDIRGKHVDATDQGYTALHLAAQHDYVSIVRYLLKCGAQVDGGPDSKCTPLHRAAYAGSLASCELLVSAGARLDAVDSSFGDLRTPLHKAALHVDVTLLLLDAGADIEARDAQGYTPLHSAAQMGNPQVIQLLLERGADKAAKDRHGRTPAHTAAMAGHEHALQSPALELPHRDDAGQEPTDLLARAPSEQPVIPSAPPAPATRDYGGTPVVVVMPRRRACVSASSTAFKHHTYPTSESPEVLSVSRIRLPDDSVADLANNIFRSLRASDQRRRRRAAAQS